MIREAYSADVRKAICVELGNKATLHEIEKQLLASNLGACGRALT
jgi:hypothetical protein